MDASIAELLRSATARLSATSATPRLDAELLLAHALAWPRARLLAERAHTPEPDRAAAFVALLDAARVQLRHGDLLAPLPEPVDLLVSNPPYTVLAEVEPNVRAHEPWLALDGGPDGAAVYRRLLAGVGAALRPGGALLLEIGAWQGALVSALAREALPGATISVHADLAGRDRVVRARLEGKR
jgi:methylase of polypeptide subunit release factors